MWGCSTLTNRFWFAASTSVVMGLLSIGWPSVASAGVPAPTLEITEVMFNPSNDSVWEWIEVRNTGGQAIDLEGWLGFNFGDTEVSSPNPTIDGSKAANTMIGPGQLAVIYDGRQGGAANPGPGSYDDQLFRNAWGLSAATPLIAADFWPEISNTNGAPGQSIAFWKTVDDYRADLGTPEDPDNPGTFLPSQVVQFNNSQFSLSFSQGFPGADGKSSITWTGNGDRFNGANWTLSQSGAHGAVTSVETSLTLQDGIDLGNPGIVSATGASPVSTLRITEILYDANEEPKFEWIEVFNPGTEQVDLAGWVVDDVNSNAHTAANIASGTVAPGGTAILYNADQVSAVDFAEAWGNGLNLVAVTNWTTSLMALNNGDDEVALWNSFASYSGDNQAHANAVVKQRYDENDGFPIPPNGASIWLNDLAADADSGFSWNPSTDSDGVSFHTTGGTLVFHDGGDVGSPGTFVVQGPIGFAGDFDGDGDVDGDDFVAWESTLGGARNGQDFLAWQREFGSSAPSTAGVAAVPEPAAAAGALLALGLSSLRRRLARESFSPRG